MDNLPNDPPDQDKNPTPPPFGSNFNPSNPPNPPSSNVDPLRSWVAKHEARDSSGRFIPTEHLKNPAQTSPPASPASTRGEPAGGPNLPPPIQVTQTNKYSQKYDPPLVDVKVTNPVTYLKKWVGKLLKNQDISLHLRIKPFATIGLVLAFSVVGGTAFGIGRYLFPNSSPIFHRQVVYPGIVQKGEGGYLLTLSDGTIWKLKPKNNNINLSNLSGKQAVITGNLTKEPYLIEVSEVIIADTQPQSQTPTSLAPQSPAKPDEVGPNIPNQDLLPKLYPGLTWEKNERKVLIFTSGRRKIEQEGVYLESAQVINYPQDFIDYYVNQLTNASFKETLNSKDPDEQTITYSKDDLFLTFGVENVYSGSGDNKKTLPAGRQVVGYKAFIEHN